MQYHFTPAAERALTYASGYSDRAGQGKLGTEALLVGLLSEPECRAANILEKLGADIHAACRRWPDLAKGTPAQERPLRQKPFSQDVEHSLQAALSRLTGFPKPLELATEHILLGLAAADNEVSAWLRQRGLDPDVLEVEIHRLYGYQTEGTGTLSAPEAFAEESPPEASGLDTDANQADGTASQQVLALRVLDAEANRAREGLRVIEDYIRFGLDDRHLTGLCKQLRHDLTAALSRISLEHCLASRETQADVGTVLTTPTERQRGDDAGVLRANFARLQESLRGLEEFGKLFDSVLAEQIKQLRYQTYTLQRAVEITRGGLKRLASARLYVLLDGRGSPEEFERLVRSVIAAGADMIQLRDKRLGDRELLARARQLHDVTRETGTPWIMNDRADLAVLAHADGVHVGQEEVSVKDARRIVGPEAFVGVSTHCIEQARQAVLDGASYIGVGPTFSSDTKSFEHFPGVELLRTVSAEIRLPAFAIGGIDRENLAEVLDTGFTRVALSGAIASAADPTSATREIAKLLRQQGDADERNR